MKSSSQTKGAVTLTFASVILFSGLWSLCYVPASGYEYRKNDQLTGVDFILAPGNSTTNTFEVKKGVEEIGMNVSPQTIPNQPYDPSQPQQDIPPVISIKVYDPEGRVVKSYGNITSLSGNEMIAVASPGKFRVDVINNTPDNSVRIGLQVYDSTKVVNHPMDAMGQWLTIISAPVFGLAAWFVIRSRRSNDG